MEVAQYNYATAVSLRGVPLGRRSNLINLIGGFEIASPLRARNDRGRKQFAHNKLILLLESLLIIYL
ncbi:MAG: hypothetical protein V1709_01970 [Planctomycetota bacterium]